MNHVIVKYKDKKGNYQQLKPSEQLTIDLEKESD